MCDSQWRVSRINGSVTDCVNAFECQLLPHDPHKQHATATWSLVSKTAGGNGGPVGETHTGAFAGTEKRKGQGSPLAS